MLFTVALLLVVFLFRLLLLHKAFQSPEQALVITRVVGLVSKRISILMGKLIRYLELGVTLRIRVGLISSMEQLP
jgi:hypothetical protein